eukprot:1613819-Amphidinium_carterae.1
MTMCPVLSNSNCLNTVFFRITAQILYSSLRTQMGRRLDGVRALLGLGRKTTRCTLVACGQHCSCSILRDVATHGDKAGLVTGDHAFASHQYREHRDGIHE